MKEYNKILVLENDLELSYLAKMVLEKENKPTENWFYFNYSFGPNRIEESFNKLKNLEADTICFANPSFVGGDNHFSTYFSLFYQLKNLGIKLDIVVIYTDNLLTKLLSHASDQAQATKKQVVLTYMKEILEFHNIYEIPYSDMELGELKISNAKPITWDLFNSLYVETHRLLNKTKFEDPNGNVFDAYSVYYYKDKEPEITLLDESNYNNSYKLSELKRV